MAPEVLQGKLKKLEPSIDVWAMGVILYCMLTGNLPFKGNSTEELKAEIMQGKVDIPHDLVRKLSPECVDVFYKTLALDHTRRLSTQELMQHPWLKDRKYDHLMKLGEVEEEKEDYRADLAVSGSGNATPSTSSATTTGTAAVTVNLPTATKPQVVTGRRASVEKIT
jgi:serine/threonine protein kinase